MSRPEDPLGGKSHLTSQLPGQTSDQVRQEEIERLRAAVAQAMRRAQTQPSAPVPKLPPVANLRLSQRAANRPTKTSVAPPVRSPSNLDPEIMPAPPEGSRRLGPILIQSSLMVGFVAMVAYAITMFSSFQPDSRAPKSSNGGASIGRMPTASAAAKQEIDSGTASAAAKQEIDSGTASAAAKQESDSGTARDAAKQETNSGTASAAAKQEIDSGTASAAAKQEIDSGTASAAAKPGERSELQGTLPRDRLEPASDAAKQEIDSGPASAAAKQEIDSGPASAAAKQESDPGPASAAAKQESDPGPASDAAKQESDSGPASDAAKQESDSGPASAAAKQESDSGPASAAAKQESDSGPASTAAKQESDSGPASTAAKQESDSGPASAAAKQESDSGPASAAAKQESDLGPASAAAKQESNSGPASAAAKQESDSGTVGAAAVKPIEPHEAAALMERGRDLLRNGDIAFAQLAFRRLAEAGQADAALALATTYDPRYLAEHNLVGIIGDEAKARAWYQRARELGSKADGILRSTNTK